MNPFSNSSNWNNGGWNTGNNWNNGITSNNWNNGLNTGNSWNNGLNTSNNWNNGLNTGNNWNNGFNTGNSWNNGLNTGNNWNYGLNSFGGNYPTPFLSTNTNAFTGNAGFGWNPSAFVANVPFANAFGVYPSTPWFNAYNGLTGINGFGIFQNPFVTAFGANPFAAFNASNSIPFAGSNLNGFNTNWTNTPTMFNTPANYGGFAPANNNSFGGFNGNNGFNGTNGTNGFNGFTTQNSFGPTAFAQGFNSSSPNTLSSQSYSSQNYPAQTGTYGQGTYSPVVGRNPVASITPSTTGTSTAASTSASSTGTQWNYSGTTESTSGRTPARSAA